MNHNFKSQIFTNALCPNCQSEVTELCLHCTESICESCHPAKVKKARTKKDAGKIGIHLLNPNINELDEAQNRAISNGFKSIWIHSDKTWPNNQK